ncbi:MAG TPA: DUF1036 domain-containing protein [Patescibacteria group bacterium]|nr:DUF1036 domain-containing protein [Patescibacteria group bacterium]
MKKMILTGVLGVLLLLVPQSAWAFGFNAQNDTERNIDFAIMYYDDGADDWLCRGWFALSANTSKRYTFPDSGVVSQVYIYAQSSGNRVWGARNPNDGMPASVVNDRFEYHRNASVPAGQNLRMVDFREYQPNSEGIISIRWTAGQG